MSTYQQNGTVHHWLTVSTEPVGQFTAQAVGLPDVCATAATRDEAIARVRELLRERIASGELVRINLVAEAASETTVRKNPNDPNEKAYLEALARDRQEDLEQTLRELDQECSNSSSIPTI